MNTVRSLLLIAALASGLAGGAWAQAVIPNAQMLGPMWQGQSVRVTGTVMAQNGACRELMVDRAGIPGAGGRLWGCWNTPDQAPDMGARVAVHGRVNTTRMTRMGPYWRVVPQVDGL